MTFLEAPESIEQMEEYNRLVGGAKLANMLEQGSTPILPPQELKKMGYTMAAYPLTLLSASIKAMTESLDRIQKGLPTDDLISTCKLVVQTEKNGPAGTISMRLDVHSPRVVSQKLRRLEGTQTNLSVFICSCSALLVAETKDAVGFTKYAEEEQRYKAD